MEKYLYYFDKKSIQINVSQHNNITRKINVNQTDKINKDNSLNYVKKQSFLQKSSYLFTKITSKSISSDNDSAFNFKQVSWYLTSIYLLSFIAIPILYSLVKTYAYHNNIKSNNLDLLIYYIIPLIGMALSFAFDWKTMIKKGAWAAYAHAAFGLISLLFVGFTLVSTKIISGKNDDPTSIATLFFFQVIFQFIGSMLVIWFCKPLRNRIIATLKEAKLDMLGWIVIFFFFATIINIFINFIPINTAKSSNSTNQDALNYLMKTPFGIFALILGTVFLAPINEEISYRQGTFTIVRYKWLGYIASLIYFPSMHVMENGDWQHILGYLSMATLMPLLFVMTRGNVVYTIGLHALWNLISTITGFIHK